MNRFAKSGTGKIVTKMLPAMFLMSAAAFGVYTLACGFGFGSLAGFLLGFVYVSFCMYYLSATVERAVDMEKKRAEKSMLRCYLLRAAGLFLLCFAGYSTGLFDPITVLPAQFFPRLTLSADALLGINHFGKE